MSEAVESRTCSGCKVVAEDYGYLYDHVKEKALEAPLEDHGLTDWHGDTEDRAELDALREEHGGAANRQAAILQSLAASTGFSPDEIAEALGNLKADRDA